MLGFFFCPSEFIVSIGHFMQMKRDNLHNSFPNFILECNCIVSLVHQQVIVTLFVQIN